MQTVIGLFETNQETNDAIARLYDAGYSENHMSLVAQEGVIPEDEHSETAESAGKGAGVGALLGLVAGVSSIAIPGVGPIIGAGTVLSGLFGGAGVGATVGGLVGLFRKWLGHDAPADHYEGAVKKGHLLLAVESGDNRIDEVKNILETAGAYDIHVHRAHERAHA